MIGTTISHYKILEKLGEGGMGVVYKAQDTKLDRIVALKFLPHHLSATEQDQERFFQEAKAAATLNHPHVCTIYDIKDEDGKQFIVMEYVDGRTLRDVVKTHRDAPLRVEDAISYAVQIGDALREAHDRAIVHRDIKSENIMVNSKNQIKVMDFGLAKLRGSLKLTRTSSTVGTLAYMAPEQIQGAPVDARSDIFSFGVVLFEILTGKLPFRGEHEAAMMYSILNEEPESVQRLLPDTSSELVHVISRALEKDPDDRYQSIHDMLIDLRRLKKQSARLTRSTAAGIPVDRETSTSSAQIAKPFRAGSRKWLFSGAVITILVVLLGIWLLPTRESKKTDSFQSMKITRVTTTGTAGNASISPDGKYIVYTVDKEGETSLWLRQVAAASSVQIVPPSTSLYLGTTFTHDGNFVYYVLSDRNQTIRVLYQLPVLGGSPRRILNGIRTPVSLSPDGQQLVFIRKEDKGEEALIIADRDGGNERKLASRFGEEFFMVGSCGPSWSPDGKTIAAPIATTKGGFQSNVMVFSVVDSSARLLSPYAWQAVSRIVWLNDGSGVILSAREKTAMFNQIWKINARDGSVQRITNDLNAYGQESLSLTSDDKALLCVQTETRSNIWVVPDGDDARARKVTFGAGTLEGGGGVTWTPDGSRIVYASAASGNQDIWIMDKDGTDQKQLTTDIHRDAGPVVTPDGQTIVFISSRTGTSHVWKMAIDGTNQTQLTNSEDYEVRCSPDGKWVVYQGFAAGYTAIWKIPIIGGTPVQLTHRPSSSPDVSPDAKYIVCQYRMAQGSDKSAVVSIDGGEPVKFLPELTTVEKVLRWSRDGKSILFRNRFGSHINVWSQPVDGSAAKPITNFQEENVNSMDWTPDGKWLVCARGSSSSDVVLIRDFR